MPYIRHICFPGKIINRGGRGERNRMYFANEPRWKTNRWPCTVFCVFRPTFKLKIFIIMINVCSNTSFPVVASYIMYRMYWVEHFHEKVADFIQILVLACPALKKETKQNLTQQWWNALRKLQYKWTFYNKAVCRHLAFPPMLKLQASYFVQRGNNGPLFAWLFFSRLW